MVAGFFDGAFVWLFITFLSVIALLVCPSLKKNDLTQVNKLYFSPLENESINFDPNQGPAEPLVTQFQDENDT